MRHCKKTDKLGRTTSHRAAVIANMLVSLVKHERVTTTLRLAKSVQRYADKLITLAKRNTLHARRQAMSALRPSGPSQKAAVRKLFEELGPRFGERKGGYTRIVKLPPRRGDAAPMAILEFVGAQVAVRAKREKREEEVAIETEVVGGQLGAEPVVEGGKDRKEEQERTSTVTSAEGREEEQTEAGRGVGPGESVEEPGKPTGKDRKGGLGRFFKGLFGKEKKE
ncbi:MAG: 50S ribosomal protein L17 [bacterium]|nr:50S ribosomal protein L17 [bacterium]